MTRAVTRMELEDAPHISAEQRQVIIDSYPEHEREARVRGLPSMGSGRVFPIAEEKIRCDPVPIPRHWVQIVGIDFGWDHPFGAVRSAWDRDSDIWYLVSSYRESKATPVIHSAALRAWGIWIPVAWPHDGLSIGDKSSGKALATLYREQGLNLLPDFATHEDGGNGVEAGIMDMLDRMQTGRFKVFRGQNEDWLSEFRTYHRKDGRLVKEMDDLISGSRYALMMKRFAEVERAPAKRPSGYSAGAGGWMGS